MSKEGNGGSKSSDTFYIVWYGDKEYYRTNVSHHDARRVFKALLAECRRNNDTTEVFLVKNRLVQKILGSSNEEPKKENDTPCQELTFNFVV